MMRLARLALFVVLALTPAAEAGAQESAAGASPDEGRRLALTICTECHVVAPEQPAPPVLRPPAPSFATIARWPGTTAQSLRTFLRTTHTTLKTPENMPNPMLTDEMAAAVVSYILSLKNPL